jgi:hypothetical protein
MQIYNRFGYKIGKTRRRVGLVCLWCAAAIMLMLTAGSASASYGNLKLDAGIQKAFDNNEILTGYNYYFSGPYYAPNAILGVDKAYHLDSRFWKPAKMTAQRLRDWLWWMNLDYNSTYGAAPRAYRIYDQNGKAIGFWYSAWTFTVIQSKADNQVSIYTPFVHDRYAPAFRPRDKK